MRLYGCNLHCAWCDSAETWDMRGRNGIVYPPRQNARALSAVQVWELLRPLNVDMVVVTGGEPLVQRDELADLARICQNHGVEVHIETNGTLSPGDRLASRVEHFVVSQKLPSAQAGNGAINLPVLQAYARMGWRRATFKVVCMSLDDLKETADLLAAVGAERRARWVMPEGVSANALAHALPEFTEQALALGFNVSGRQHVMLWGDERGR